MTPGEFIKVFDTIAEAPGGTERLRELVLQLAVRGRLVPQDANEEPSSVLLERIADEKFRLFREGKLRMPKPLAPIAPEEAPFDVPDQWEWVRLGDITNSRLGKMLDKSKNKGPYRRYLRNANVQWFQFDLSDVLELQLEDTELEEYSVRENDLIVCEGGEPGRTAICGPDVDGMVFQKALHRIRPWCGISTWYLAYLLRCDTWSQRINTLFTGATIKHLTGKALATHTVPLPPLSEQHRIVAKVNELMGLIDRLEAARRSREAVRIAGRDSALAALRNAATSEEVETAWTRIAERMDELFTALADLAPLRETVLQLAVRGRLVTQDADDESAAALLEHIAEERARLVRAKKIGKQKPVSDLDHSATAVELPSGWTWTCTAALGVVNPRNVAEDDAMVSFCPMPVIPTDYRQRIAPETRRWGEIKKGYTHFAEGDVVVAKITPCFQNRKSCVMTGLEGGIGAGTTELHVIRIIANKVVPEYLLLFYKSPDFLQMGVATMTGTAGQQRVPTDYFAYTPLPLPPLAEQYRIVAKVDELMGLIDRLEQHLVAKERTQGDLVVACAKHVRA